jgi:hypothetical protein
VLLQFIIDQFELRALMRAGRHFLGRGRQRVEQGAGQARDLVGWGGLACATAPTRPLQVGQRLSDLRIEAIFDDTASVKGLGKGSPWEHWICTR